MRPPPAATAGTFPARGCALFAKLEGPLSQLSGPSGAGAAGRGGAQRGPGSGVSAPRAPSQRVPSPSLPPPTGKSIGGFLCRCPRGPLASGAHTTQPGAGTPSGKFAPGRARHPHLVPGIGARRSQRADGGDAARAVWQSRCAAAGSPRARGVQVALDGMGRCRAETPRSRRTPFQTPQRGLLSPIALRPFGSASLSLVAPRATCSPLPGAARCGSGVRGAISPRPASRHAVAGQVRSRGPRASQRRPGSASGPPGQRVLGPSPSRCPAPGRSPRGGDRAGSARAGAGVWSEPTCISTHVLATRGCSRRRTAARGGHRDAAPRAVARGSPGSAAAAAAGRSGVCFASAQPWPWLCDQSCVARPPALPRTSFVHS